MDNFCAEQKKSMRQNTCCKTFVADKSRIHAWPLEKEAYASLAMKLFVKHIGVSEALMTDGSKAESSDEVKSLCVKIMTDLKKLDQGTPWARIAELRIIMLGSIM